MLKGVGASALTDEGVRGLVLTGAHPQPVVFHAALGEKEEKRIFRFALKIGFILNIRW